MSTREPDCFRYDKIRQFDTLERQTMQVNKYEGTFPMASFIKKTCVIREKRHGVKNNNTQLFLQVRN